MRDYEEKSYYEIQLDNKQLILVFLAAVTVCVLIFVLGVMIGKGQKETEIAAAARTEKNVAVAEPDANTPSQPLSDTASETRSEKKTAEKETRKKPQPSSEKEAEAATPTPVSNKKQYAYEDLDRKEPDEKKPAVEEKKPPVQEKKQAEAAPVAEPVSDKPETTDTEDNVPKPSGGAQYTVQIMATSSRPKAEQQITTLKSKGYKPFLDESKNGDASVFKVRVGRFADTQDAKAMAAKIKKDLGLETWVAVLD
jgi:FtsZ-interacting cell division protein ZipA